MSVNPKIPRAPRGLPQTRIELHVHLDGSVRVETAYELALKKGLPLPGKGTFHDFRKKIAIENPKDLQRFLRAFDFFAPSFIGDLCAIKRMALEFCEDAANNGILYTEVRQANVTPSSRFCPHLLLKDDEPEVTPDEVVKVVLEGLREGESLNKIKVQLILCCINGLPQFSKDILRLCEKYRDEGVVGIDIAGSESAIAQGGGAELFTAMEENIFHEARKLGVHRTVHAGEMGPPENVLFAIDHMHAERIGHGYRILADEKAYKRCRDENIHFEVCPTSSILTGSVPIYKAATLQHPILRFAQDEVNFSINTDDPTVTGTTLDYEYRMLGDWGMTEGSLCRANFNAARSCFLPDHDRRKLIRDLQRNVGVVLDDNDSLSDDDSTTDTDTDTDTQASFSRSN